MPSSTTARAKRPARARSAARGRSGCGCTTSNRRCSGHLLMRGQVRWHPMPRASARCAIEMVGSPCPARALRGARKTAQPSPLALARVLVKPGKFVQGRRLPARLRRCGACAARRRGTVLSTRRSLRARRRLALLMLQGRCSSTPCAEYSLPTTCRLGWPSACRGSGSLGSKHALLTESRRTRDDYGRSLRPTARLASRARVPNKAARPRSSLMRNETRTSGRGRRRPGSMRAQALAMAAPMMRQAYKSACAPRSWPTSASLCWTSACAASCKPRWRTGSWHLENRSCAPAAVPYAVREQARGLSRPEAAIREMATAMVASLRAKRRPM